MTKAETLLALHADNARLRALLGEARKVLPDPTAIRYSLIKRIDAELAKEGT